MSRSYHYCPDIRGRIQLPAGESIRGIEVTRESLQRLRNISFEDMVKARAAQCGVKGKCIPGLHVSKACRAVQYVQPWLIFSGHFPDVQRLRDFATAVTRLSGYPSLFSYDDQLRGNATSYDLTPGRPLEISELNRELISGRIDEFVVLNSEEWASALIYDISLNGLPTTQTGGWRCHQAAKELQAEVTVRAEKISAINPYDLCQ